MTVADLRYRIGPDFTLICPICACAVTDATVHTAWHASVAKLVNEVEGRKASR